jgi:hypothetical protein
MARPAVEGNLRPKREQIWIFGMVTKAMRSHPRIASLTQTGIKVTICFIGHYLLHNTSFLYLSVEEKYKVWKK